MGLVNRARYQSLLHTDWQKVEGAILAQALDKKVRVRVLDQLCVRGTFRGFCGIDDGRAESGQHRLVWNRHFDGFTRGGRPRVTRRRSCSRARRHLRP